MRILSLILVGGVFTLPVVQGWSQANDKKESIPSADPSGSISLTMDGLTVTPNEIMSNALNLIQRREYQLADEILASLLSRPSVVRPIKAQATYLRGRIALAEQKPAEGLVWFRLYVQDYADQVDAPYVNFLLGQTYKNIGAYDRARENFYKTLSFAVNKASSLTLEDYSASVRLTQAAAWELAESEYLANNWSRANDLYERFKKQNPDVDILVGSATYRMADCSYQQGKLGEAISRYELALAQAPFHPFATESWLRLVSLYGGLGEIKRQVDAIQCFIWMVNTLSPEDKLYWQRRCADMLLAEYKENPQKQVPVLETILAFDSSESWMKMLDFYISLLNRQVPDAAAKNIPLPSDKARDDWREWLLAFNDRLDTLRKDTDQVKASNKTTGSPPKP
jgi:TolA-binding protein